MKATKKTTVQSREAEIIDAVHALATEKDISEDMLFGAIEEALKAAYKKNVSREETAPANLSVTLDRHTGIAHVGHRILLEKARKTANRENVPLVVQTFAKHPLQLLDPEHCPPMLTTLEERIRLMEKYGVDIYCALPFTEKVRNTLPEEFVGRLVSRWKPRAVVVGFNYSFGKDGSGSPAILRALGNALRFETIVIPAITIGERPVSATEIRSLLANGCVRQARRLLGRPYSRMND